MRSRRSVRAFKPQPLHRELVQEMLDDAASAPSGANIQPWRVHAVSGEVKDELASTAGGGLPRRRRTGAHALPRPAAGGVPRQAVDFGTRYYTSLGIDRNDAFGAHAPDRAQLLVLRRAGRPHLQHRPPAEAAQLDRPGPLRAERDDRRQGTRHRHLPAGRLRAVPRPRRGPPADAAGRSDGVRHVHGLRRPVGPGEPGGHAPAANQTVCAAARFSGTASGCLVQRADHHCVSPRY
jgi:nitroreductase